MADQPLDVLTDAVGEAVQVRLKSGEVFLGGLSGFDEHMNLVLDPMTVDIEAEAQATLVEDTTVIRGDNVM